ncbi:oligosaccharide flippase family protein [Spirosoma migulaei]
MRNVHPRTRKVQFNTIIGLFLKGGGMIISLLLLPLTIDYLSKDTYGTWLTISSVVTMMSFLDIGIGNGLRNKISEAVSKGDKMLARAYISTAYVIFGTIQLTVILLFSLLEKYIPWQQIFNTTLPLDQLRLVIWLIIVAMAIKLILDILTYILFALQEPSQVALISFLSNILILAGTYALSRLNSGNLVYLALITSLIPVVIMLISSFIMYGGQLKEYTPSIRLGNVKYGRSLLSLGYKFFFIQIAVLILFYTDNLVIAQLFGPSEVTTYNVAFRYFNAINILFSIIITPYWSAFTEAAANNDIQWMKRSYDYLQKLWLGLFVAVLIMIFIAKIVYSFWIGDRVVVPTVINVVMGMSILIICWNNITVSVINGLGKVKVQLLCSIFAALTNIPLSIYLAQQLEIGSASVMIATCLSLLPATVTGTIQAKKLSNGRAKGIWAK